MIVITGPFDLKQGHPYFIGATMDWDRWTWVGKVPERITFNLKPEANYITLPLDTSLKKAVDLCNSLEVYGETEMIGSWDPLRQNYFNGVEHGAFSECWFIRENPNDARNFNLSAGAMYYIGGLTQEMQWTQA